jgi:hypothetical protein
MRYLTWAGQAAQLEAVRRRLRQPRGPPRPACLGTLFQWHSREAIALSSTQRTAIVGAILGLLAGLVALSGVLAIAVRCLPYRISSPAQHWPWFCSDPVYPFIGYFAFPANVLSNELSSAIQLAPLSLLVYASLGALIAFGLSGSSTASPRQ